EAAQSLRTPRRVIERRKPTASHADQVEAIELEVIGEQIEIAGDAPGLWPGCRIGQAFAPAPAVEGDDAESGAREARGLGLPNSAGAGVGVEEHDGSAGAAGVGEP